MVDVETQGVIMIAKRKNKVKEPKRVVVHEKPHNGVFLPDCLAQVKLIAMRGSSDDEIADAFGIDKRLFQKWKATYPSFSKALREGRTHPDTQVVESLFKRAVGYEYKEDGLTRTGQIRELRRHLPGDVGAIRYWLNNRQREHWLDRSSHEVQGGPPGSPPVNVATRSDLIRDILALVQPKPDGPSKPSEK